MLLFPSRFEQGVNMRIGIAGAGAVGCHYGSLLQQAGNDVVFLARGAHLRALRESGLVHVSGGRERVLRVRASDDAAILADRDVVILACKTTGLAAMLTAIAPHVGKEALAVTLQNGVEAPEWVAAALPGRAVAAGTAFIGVRIERPGVVVHSAAGGIRLGLWRSGPGGHLLALLIAALDGAGVPVRQESNVPRMLWRKLLWNCGFNAITAITRRYAHEIAAIPETLDIVRAAMEETVAVARAQSVEIGGEDVRKHVEVTLRMGPVKTSMWQDIERGRRTEVDAINGFVVHRAEELGIKAPVNRMLTALVHAAEGGAH